MALCLGERRELLHQATLPPGGILGVNHPFGSRSVELARGQSDRGRSCLRITGYQRGPCLPHMIACAGAIGLIPHTSFLVLTNSLLGGSCIGQSIFQSKVACYQCATSQRAILAQ